MPETGARVSSLANPFVEMLEALSDRHGQVDLRLDRVAVRLPFGGRSN